MKLITRRGESGSRERDDFVRKMGNAESDLSSREQRNAGKSRRKKNRFAQVGQEKEKNARNDNFAEESSRARERRPRINLNIDMTLPREMAMLGGASLNAGSICASPFFRFFEAPA